MFTEIFLFELKYRIRRPATWIYFLVFFLLAFLFMIFLGGADENITVSLGDNAKTNANSPFNLNGLISSLSFFAIPVISAIIGNSVYRDFEHNIHALFYTKPITKLGYLGGRFFGAFLVTLLVLSSIGFGLFAGTVSPWVNETKIGAFNFMAYLQPYLIYVIPNTLFTGAIFFTSATLLRSMVPNYVGSVLLLVLFGVASSLMADLDNQTLAGLLDPLGGQAGENATRYWTVFEKNNLLVPIDGILLINRVIWTGVGLLIFGLCYWRFRFAHQVARVSKPAQSIQLQNPEEPQMAEQLIAPEEDHQKLRLPEVSIDTSGRYRLRQWWRLTWLEFSSIVRNAYFPVIVMAGIALLFVNGAQIGKLFGTPTFPVTYQVTDILGGTFALFMLIIVIFYSGELIWRERGAKINQMIDALPIPNGMVYGSKLAALMLVQVLLLLVVMLCGMLIQAMKGYTNFEIGLYIKSLFGVRLIYWWLMCVLALLVQVLVNNKFLGHFVVIVYYLFSLFMGQLGLEHDMWKYADTPGMFYSDMNGYGHFTWPFIVYNIYWMGFAILLAVLSNLYFVRGTETAFKARRKIALARMSRRMKLVTVSGLLIFLGVGGFIFYNTNILNESRSDDETEELFVRYEKEYGKYRSRPQPTITGVKLNVDIFPQERDVNINGTFRIRNNEKEKIDSVHVQLPDNAEIKKLQFGRSAKLIKEDKELGYFIYRFDAPLQPGDSTTLDMDLAYVTKGFDDDTRVVYNGTFFNSSYLPSFGYNPDAELSDEDDRKKNELPKKERMLSVFDTLNYCVNALNADWVDFEATVSTSADQIALAPGYLVKEWKDKGRNYFQYKMDQPILNFYAFLSGRYEVKRDKWKDVSIEIYYDKKHPYNVDRMIRAIKKSLDYYTKTFTPYQHRQVRIIEFPRYASFAQSFPNTFPYSESIGFIADVDDEDPEAIDYPFYVVAHETAHQWWAHQVIGSNTQGAGLMTETMSQYSALMVMEDEYGPEKMRKFLKYEMDQYLRGRSAESRKELPMITMEGQQYIHYNKGSLVMYALKDYIGEDTLNAALRRYLQKTAFQREPYTNSLEFVEHLRRATPDSLKHIITDLFETITLFENRVTDYKSEKLSDTQYKVTLTIETKKFRADSLGGETEIPINDWIDVGVFGSVKEDKHFVRKAFYFKKHKFTKPSTTLELIVDVEKGQKPSEGGIDPYNKLIDRHPNDNTRGKNAVIMVGG